MSQSHRILIAVILSLFVIPVPVDASSECESVSIGIAGTWKLGVWTPVVWTNEDSQTVPVAVEAPDNDGVWVRYPIVELGQNRFGAVVRMGKKEQLRVIRSEKREARSEKEDNLASLPPLSSHREVILVIGTEDEAEFVRRSVTYSDTDIAHKPAVIQVNSIEELNAQILPGDVRSLQVIDRVVWFYQTGTDVSAPELMDWLQRGGDLTVSLRSCELRVASCENAKRSSEVIESKKSTNLCGNTSLATRNSQLATIFAGETPVLQCIQTRTLEQYAGSDLPIPKLGFGQQYELKAVRLPIADDAVVECAFMDLPLIYRQAVGFGRLTVCAFDLNAQQIQKWGNRERFLRRVLDVPEQSDENIQRYSTNSILHYGYDDLSGQLASGLNQYTGVQLPSFWLVALVLMAFIALIGAGDYYLWRKLGLPTWITWISFPIYILVFCGLFYGMSQYHSNTQVRTNWATVIDVDYSTGLQQGFFYGDVLVPRADRYNIGVASCELRVARDEKEGVHNPQSLVPSPQSPNTLSWFGSTGQGISGMNSSTQTFANNSDFYMCTPNTGLESVPIASRATRNVVGNFVTAEESSQPLLTFSLKEDQNKPSGTITNQSKDTELNECLLLYGEWAFPIGDLKPGQSVTVDDALQRYSLNAVLVGKRVQMSDVSVKYSNETIPYNPTSLNPEDPIRAMMFYKASGGAAYTKLDSGYQAPTDFSSLIKLHRAVLLCKVSPKQASQKIQLNVTKVNSKEGVKENSSDSDCRLMFYRFVIPVGR